MKDAIMIILLMRCKAACAALKEIIGRMTVDTNITEKTRPFTPEDIAIIKTIHRGIQYLHKHSTPETFNKEEQLLTLKDAYYSDPETKSEVILTGIHQEMVIDGRCFAVSDFREGTSINGVSHTYFAKTVSDAKTNELILKETMIDGFLLV
ncbi:MAG: hypothetical protein ACI4NM_08185 [Bullifex sp.]